MNLDSMQEALNDRVGKKDILSAWQTIITYIQALEKRVGLIVQHSINDLSTRIDKRLATIENGKDGEPGAQGLKGDKGDQGEPGESITGPQGEKGDKGDGGDILNIAALGTATRDGLELLQGDERLDKSAIKGLDEEFKKLATRGAGGGGLSQMALQFAMGKLIKHQVFTTSSATTTSTLSNKVANNVCIWLRYNGQMLNYGTQYTISGTTITYTFTLDDSSEVEATYLAG